LAVYVRFLSIAKKARAHMLGQLNPRSVTLAIDNLKASSAGRLM
jgi:hypothetical protein